jgi:hypothetical protein
MITSKEFRKQPVRITCHKSFLFHRRPIVPRTPIKPKAQTSILSHKCHSCRSRIVKIQPLQKLRSQDSASWTGKPKARRARSPIPLTIANNPVHHAAIKKMTATNSDIMRSVLVCRLQLCPDEAIVLEANSTMYTPRCAARSKATTSTSTGGLPLGFGHRISSKPSITMLGEIGQNGLEEIVTCQLISAF